MALMAGKKDKDTERAFQQVLKIVEDTDSVEQEFKRLEVNIMNIMCCVHLGYESIATVGEIRVYWRADFQSGSRVLKKVF